MALVDVVKALPGVGLGNKNVVLNCVCKSALRPLGFVNLLKALKEIDWNVI